jgi:hypothetical protein
MDMLNQSDAELENLARAQAEAIAEAQAAAHAEAPSTNSLFVKMGLSKAAPSAPQFIPKPGRELLIWRIKAETDVRRALTLSYTLFNHPDFIATVPAERSCPIAVYQARRKWNDAAKQWTQLGDPKGQTWLRCDRKLMLRRTGQGVSLQIERKDLDVSFDPKEQKLVPVRVEITEPVTFQTLDQVLARFPNLTAKQVVDGMRVPTRFFHHNLRPRAAPDAYVANAPLFVSNMEIFMQDKKKVVEEKDDPNKGFVTWLSNTLRTSK